MNMLVSVRSDEGFDTVEEILDYIEETFPLPSLIPNNPLAEAATGDFFSKFCFYIKVRKGKV
jgi:glutathione S-transferase